MRAPRLLLPLLLGVLLTACRLAATLPHDGAEVPRSHQTLTGEWRTLFVASSAEAPADVLAPTCDDSSWRAVEVPHNWDTYHGYAQAKHGQLHGTAWYRRSFALDGATLDAVARDEQRVFLLFEGVGSYATVWLNGREIGHHAGGLTTFTLDATAALHTEAARPQLLVVRAEHPAGIRDLPWVCGGCERAYGFSEGSQPFGLNRPVHIVVTNPLRIAPFGVHVWNDRSVTPASATAHTRTEVTNHAATPRTFLLRQTLLGPDGTVIATTTSAPHTLAPGATATLGSEPLTAEPAQLWSLASPTLYTVRSELLPAAQSSLTVVATSASSNLSTFNPQLSTASAPPAPMPIDALTTSFGFRWIDWPHGADLARGTFLLNGESVFLNGTCEYQHLLGGGHAFSAAQVAARVRQIEAAGFNAFRDAHHPHDLRYNQHFDHDGIAWWTQFGAQIWFDRDDFRQNYLALLRDWVKERRNSPSLVLWGLQNESKLPTAFAAAATALIRELDPTCGDQRLVTTCNGGTGTDWDVPQNWTGTYGGDPATYADDLRRQLLVGEYGAWRSAGLHEAASIGRPLRPATASPLPGYDEDTFTALLETKIRLAHAARAASAGHFQWIFSTHDNPGRYFGARGEQLADGWALLDRVGPANNKGLLTTWGEPLDAFYMYRANFVPPERAPMVVIAGANWPDRIIAPGPAEGLVVYSNAAEVELFNGPESLGVRTRQGLGTHFRWDGVTLRHRELRAIARHAGHEVARDAIELPLLPSAAVAAGRPTPNALRSTPAVAAPTGEVAAGAAWHVLYRVNCGGPAYVDAAGQTWAADRDASSPSEAWGARSWAHAYPHLPPALASVGRIHLPITGTSDPALYQTFRYGRADLAYSFAVPEGDLRLELHFAEPWYGRGGIDATGWRLFDIAVNGRTVRRDVDLFARAGFAAAHREVIETHVTGGRLEITFPRVAAYQAVINAIVVSSRQPAASATASPQELVHDVTPGATLESWLDTGDALFPGTPARIARLPESLRHQPWLRRATSAPAALAFTLRHDAGLYAAFLPDAASASPSPDWTPLPDHLTTTSAEAPSLSLRYRHARAGERLEFAAASAPHLVVVVPARPVAPAQAIRDLRVENSATPQNWQAAGSLQRGARPHGPNGPGLTHFPADLSDADWLITPASEPDQALRVLFTAADHVDVTLGLDAAAAPPPWLAAWLPLPEQTVRLGDRSLALFRRRYAVGATVELGAPPPVPDGAPASLYVVFVRPTRASVDYAAPDSALDASAPTHAWEITVGVGDRYGLVLPVRPASSPSPARLRCELLDRHGTVLCSDEQDVAALRADPADWRPWRFRTCTSVNAGTYLIRVTLLTGEAVTLGALTVE